MKKPGVKSEQAKQRSEQLKKETSAKVNALGKKAAEAKGEAKAAIEARTKEIRKRMDHKHKD